MKSIKISLKSSRNRLDSQDSMRSTSKKVTFTQDNFFPNKNQFTSTIDTQSSVSSNRNISSSQCSKKDSNFSNKTVLIFKLSPMDGEKMS